MYVKLRGRLFLDKKKEGELNWRVLKLFIIVIRHIICMHYCTRNNILQQYCTLKKIITVQIIIFFFTQLSITVFDLYIAEFRAGSENFKFIRIESGYTNDINKNN